MTKTTLKSGSNFFMSRTCFRVNPHSIVAWMSRNYLPETNDIWSLSDYNGTRTHNHLVCKRTLNHLAKMAKWLSCFVSNYLYGAFERMLLSYHARVSEWIHTSYGPEYQETPYSKQARCLKFKWLQQDSNPQPLSL